jgi:hypothetical protein
MDPIQTSADARRRWLGLFFLAMAFGLLVWGQTVLRPHLDGFGFLLYWLACFLFTAASIVTAILDVRATRRRTRAEHRELIAKTLEEVDEDAQRRGSGRRGSSSPTKDAESS